MTKLCGKDDFSYIWHPTCFSMFLVLIKRRHLQSDWPWRQFLQWWRPPESESRVWTHPFCSSSMLERPKHQRERMFNTNNDHMIYIPHYSRLQQCPEYFFPHIMSSILSSTLDWLNLLILSTFFLLVSPTPFNQNLFKYNFWTLSKPLKLKCQYHWHIFQ